MKVARGHMTYTDGNVDGKIQTWQLDIHVHVNVWDQPLCFSPWLRGTNEFLIYAFLTWHCTDLTEILKNNYA